VQTAKGFDPDKFDPKDPKQVYQPVDPAQPTFKVYDPADPNQTYEPGEAILGLHTAGIADIAEELGPAVKKLSAELDDVQAITTSLKNGVLSGSSQKNLQDTLASLKVIGQNWQDASNKLPGIATGAQEAVDKANQTLETAKDAAADLQKTLQNIRGLIQKASEGQGLIGQLLTNRQLADNFNALVVNLREHGVLFYRNSPSGETPAPSPTPTRDRKRQ
jgi:ABC-type transporter Mla subunit MlaD